jgi:hypothetical protein
MHANGYGSGYSLDKNSLAHIFNETKAKSVSFKVGRGDDRRPISGAQLVSI